MNIRPIEETDWHAILHIQNMVYGNDIPESEAVLRSKIQLGNETCLVITDPEHRVIGYCLSHPWTATPASLHTIYTKLSHSSLLYIHDIAIIPSYAGKGLGYKVLHYLTTWAQAHDFSQLSLVSLAQAVTYWRRQGFEPTDYKINELEYGQGACHMLKQI